MEINSLSFNHKDILITGGAGFVGSNIAMTIQNYYPSARITIFDKYENKLVINSISINKYASNI